jgi:ATP/maltotriose-dependent transcriptional regulator MalT
MSLKDIITPPIDRSRIVAPSTPANFISRKHLFHLFETGLPGVTVVAAPAGYGKSALVGQWAENSALPTVWLTVNSEDSIQSFFAHVLAAIQIKFPDFGSEFENEPSANPLINVQKLTGAAGELKEAFNFVLDNGPTDSTEVTTVAQAMIDFLPNNVHLIIVRRVTPATSLARYASLGNLSLITSQDLKFSEEEVLRIAEVNGLTEIDTQSAQLISRCEGWPAAVQMMTRSISRGQHYSQFEMSGSTNPLAILASETFNALNLESKSKISRLLVVKEFDLETAAIILGTDFSESFIFKLATDGMFVSTSSGNSRVFKFNEIVYDGLAEASALDPEVSKSIHERLSNYYLQKGNSSKALEHIFKSGNHELLIKTLETSIREMAAIGRGDQLIKWSEFSADSSVQGEVMKRAIQVVGHLANLDFAKAEAMASELELISAQSSELNFVTQLTSMIFAHIYFARGEFTRSLEMIDKALNHQSPTSSLENTDLIALLRLKASIKFLYDDSDEINAALVQARSLMSSGNLVNAPYHLSCINALALWSEGRFFEAAEQAEIAINQAQIKGYASVSAPLDALLVLARCQLEFSQIEKASDTLALVMEKAGQSQIWPWYLMAEGTRARISITKGQIPQMMEIIRVQRERIAALKSPNELSWLIDMTEVFLRFTLDDWDRAEELLRRMPKIEMVRQIDINAKFKAEPKKVPALIEAFPENTPREKVNKFLYQATINIDHENLSLSYLNKALEVGAEVGFHEYFVRQHRLYPIMVKAAAAQPTVFRESVVQEMTERIQAMNSNTGALEEKLTARELEILKHLTTGVPLSSIAKQLHISQNTMKTHLRNVYRKLDVDGRHTAVEKAKKLLLI